LGSSLSFVAGFSVVFITFGASASAVGQFLRQNRAVLAPVAGALILLFGLHLLGWLAKLNLRVGIAIGAVLVGIGLFSAWQGGGIISGFRPIHFISLSIGFLGPVVARWLNRDVHLRSQTSQPTVWSGFFSVSPLHLDGRRALGQF
jgi:cytochrome c biogenesis protein CcdA